MEEGLEVSAAGEEPSFDGREIEGVFGAGAEERNDGVLLYERD